MRTEILITQGKTTLRLYPENQWEKDIMERLEKDGDMATVEVEKKGRGSEEPSCMALTIVPRADLDHYPISELQTGPLV